MLSIGSESELSKSKVPIVGLYDGGNIVKSVFYCSLKMIYVGGLECWHLVDQLVPLWPFHGCPPPSLSCGIIIATQMVILFAACTANSMAAFVVPIQSNKNVGDPCVCRLVRYIPGNQSSALTHLGPLPRLLFYALQIRANLQN